MDDDSTGDVTDDEWQAPKRLALHDSNIPRYEKEFVELSLIGMSYWCYENIEIYQLELLNLR